MEDFDHNSIGKLAVVTYLRCNENIPNSLYGLLNKFNDLNFSNICLYVFSDNNRKIDYEHSEYGRFRLIVDGGKTKYERLRKIVTEDKEDYILSIDSDIVLQNKEIIDFLFKFILSNSSLGFGVVGVSNNGLLPEIIKIDKFISHSIIRPFLWKFHLGITIPGQCFIIKTSDFNGILPDSNTYLDDLQIGLIVRKYNLKIYMSRSQLCTEAAKETISGLFIQRKRWATGYSSVLRMSFFDGFPCNILTIFHGLVYHFSLIVLLIVLFILGFKISHLFSFSLFCTLVLFLADFKVNKIFYVILYIFIFIFIHLFWFFNVVKTLFSSSK
jgi:cellulose synthase/poly-beta-1,6-N-acetylglucosamine synthase-like glycosyltransferase